MDGLAQFAAQAETRKPVNISGTWYHQGAAITPQEAQALMNPVVVPQQAAGQQQAALPNQIAQAQAEQARLQKVGQNPLGAGADMIRESLAKYFGLR